LTDWPDYNSSGDESDASEVEKIVAAEDRTDSQASTSTPQKSPPKEAPAVPPPSWNIPEDDHTAQRIMNLLTEMGSSNLVLNYDDTHFLHCINCTGRILHV
jgi:hypothetical protein